LARVLVSMKIFPSDIDVNLEELKKEIVKKIPSFASIHKFEEEPIAFGLVALIAYIVLPEDRSGGIDEVESSLQKIEKISDFQTLMVSRV